MSIRGACKTVKLSRTVYYYQPDLERDQPVIDELLALAEQYPRRGFGKFFSMLRRQGYRWNHKRVYRIYCNLKLNMRRKGKKRLPSRHPESGRSSCPLLGHWSPVRWPCWRTHISGGAVCSGPLTPPVHKGKLSAPQYRRSGEPPRR